MCRQVQTAAIIIAAMIVNRLSRLLGERRISVREVARRTKIAESSLYDFYNDRTTLFARETLDRLCRELNVTVGELLEYQSDEPHRT